MEYQARVTDLVPKGLASIFGLFLLGLGAIAGLEALHMWMPEMARYGRDGKVATFDLAGPATLAVWCSSAWLGLAGMVSLLVYSVRRWRNDDYSGRYRIWVWAAMCCFLLSVDATANLHEGFKDTMIALTGRRLLGDGTIWWLLPSAFGLGAIGLRVLMDMRRCKLAIMALLMAVLAYTATALVRAEVLLAGRASQALMVAVGSHLLGDLLLVTAMALQARRVIIDAALPLDEEADYEAADEINEEQAEEEPEAAEEPVFESLADWSADEPHGVPAPVIKHPQQRDHDAMVGEGKLQRLSKSERKAMRQKLERMRSERERRLGG